MHSDSWKNIRLGAIALCVVVLVCYSLYFFPILFRIMAELQVRPMQPEEVFTPELLIASGVCSLLTCIGAAIAVYADSKIET